MCALYEAKLLLVIDNNSHIDGAKAAYIENELVRW